MLGVGLGDCIIIKIRWTLGNLNTKNSGWSGWSK